MRILAIDLGDARTGLALADTITGIASPLALIETPIDRSEGRALLDELARVLREQPRDTEILMGYPINMDDTIGPRARLVESFALKLAAAANRPITLVDERRTSVAADAAMSRSGLTHKQKKKRRDAIAAAAIATLALESPESRVKVVNPDGSTEQPQHDHGSPVEHDET